MKRSLIVILAVAVSTALVAAPQPSGRRGNPGTNRGPGMMRAPRALAQVLDLTQEQIQQVATLRDNMRTAVAPLRDQLRANRQNVRAAVDAGDAQKAGELMIAGKDIRAQIKAEHDKFETSFESLLTPEQKAKLDVARELNQARRGRRRPGA